MKKLSPEEIDERGARLEKLKHEIEDIRSELRAQIGEHGFVPPRALKSKRLEGDVFRATLSFGTDTIVIDTEVEKIKEATSESIFKSLFTTVTKYTVAASAYIMLAGTLPEGAPKNLRAMFHKAVETEPKSPSLEVERKKKINEMSELRERRTPGAAGA